MKGWKLGVASLAVCTAIGVSAWGQNLRPANRQQTSRATGRYVVQTSWQDHQDGRRDRDDRDRDNNRWRNDRRDHNDRAYRDDHGRYGYEYGNRNYGYRPYGTYRGYGQGPVYGYSQPVYGPGGSGQYGYRSGYGYGNNAAAQMGYQDGFSYGQTDAARGKRYDATGSEPYENADRGYNSSFGDRSAYRQEYRQAYQQGYNAGYNGGGYRR